MIKIGEALDRLRDEADWARHRGKEGEADFLTSIVEDLDQARLEDWQLLLEQVLPLSVAAARAGYHVSAFSKPRRDFPVEPLPNGRGEGVRIRDCPCKAGRMLVLLGLEPIPEETDDEELAPRHDAEAVFTPAFNGDELAAFRDRRRYTRRRSK
jgi:hypothetical protein